MISGSISDRTIKPYKIIYIIRILEWRLIIVYCVLMVDKNKYLLMNLYEKKPHIGVVCISQYEFFWT